MFYLSNEASENNFDKDEHLRQLEKALRPDTKPRELNDALLLYVQELDNQPLTLAYSGGTDSLLLRQTADRSQASWQNLLLLSVRGGRDEAGAREFAKETNISLDLIEVDDQHILEVISEHRVLLAPLQDYTQRILTICEIILCKAAKARNTALITGHGPEAILGGFKRQVLPDPDRPQEILSRIILNVTRLEAVAKATKQCIFLPYYDPEIFGALVAMRRAGKTKLDLEANLDFSVNQDSLKSSLQNGSGVHYAFQKMAKLNGVRKVSEYMESLIQ